MTIRRAANETPITKDIRQTNRFIEAALELGCDPDEAKFNAALGKVARHKPVVNVKEGDAEKVSSQRKGHSAD